MLKRMSNHVKLHTHEMCGFVGKRYYFRSEVVGLLTL